MLFQTSTTTLNGKTFTDGLVYVAKRDWASGNFVSDDFILLSTKEGADALAAVNNKAGVYTTISLMPDGYKKGEILFQSGTVTVNGTTFTDGLIYVAIRNWVPGATKSNDFALFTTKDAQDALIAANRNTKTS
ncbi:hypothetical protein LWM68_41030 [Niabella sp. W65]|nr:hypothetical protein [Niabella sp. W65]MCH7368558.1 hypothetical protein [Niabella sp. W65]ULT44148.1 hypothetical protein KRR40_12730 [Niabella sp. I65]